MSNFKFISEYLYLFILFILFILVTVVLFNYWLSSTKHFYEAFNNETVETNIVLIGDSILNNFVYVFENESVPELIKREIKGSVNKRTMYNFAKDGATIQDCYSQLKNMDEHEFHKNTHIYVSAGGNDILNSRDNISSEFVENLFEKYSRLITAIKKQFPDANIVSLNLYYPLKPSYKIFHPVITQWNQLLDDNRVTKGYSILKLDDVIVGEEDIVYDVEPSLQGGQKIANAIVHY